MSGSHPPTPHTHRYMGRRALFFSVVVTVACATAEVGATDSSNWLPLPNSNDPSQVEASTFSWIPRTAPVPHVLVEGDVCGFVGQRAIGGDAWRNLPPALQAGFQVTLGPRQWWVRPVAGYYHASGSGEYRGPGEYDLSFGSLGSVRETEARGTLSATIDEIDLGVGHDWSCRWLRLDGATGAAWVRASLEDHPAATLFRQLALADLSPRYDQAQTIAWWSSLGLSAKLGDARIGLAARYTYAPMRVFDRTLEAGGFQVGGTVGCAW